MVTALITENGDGSYHLSIKEGPFIMHQVLSFKEFETTEYRMGFQVRTYIYEKNVKVLQGCFSYEVLETNLSPT